MSNTKSEGGLISFRALQLANEHRSSYGLRYNDYNRYRNHCANRTHRLRSSLKMTHGKSREFRKLPPVTLENLRDGHLQLLLFEAERAWAYSQELHTKSLLPANSANASKIRHNGTSRFRRAVHWSTQLLSHCQSLLAVGRFTAENMVEATAYTLILSGRFLRYRDDFEDALHQLVVTRALLDELVKTANSSLDQALATFFADEIAPEIRHCSHQLGNANAYDVDAIVRDVAPKQRTELVPGYGALIVRLKAEGQASSNVAERKRLRELLWEGNEVPIRNPELVDVLLEVQDAEAQLSASDAPKTEQEHIEKGKRSKGSKSRKGVAAYDRILLALSDAEEVARKLVESQQASAASSTSRSGTRDIHFVHSYIVFQLLSWRIERDLALISALIASPFNTVSKQAGKVRTTKERETTDARVNPAVVKMLDTVVQSLDHMRSLSIVDESFELANAVDARLSFSKSKRCLYLARSYAAVKQFAQALALTQKAHIYIREAGTLATFQADPINTSSPNFYPFTKDSLAELDAQLLEDDTTFKQDWFAFNGGAVTSERDARKKPLFFDIALNYVQLDMDRLQERAGIKRTATKVRQQQLEPKSTLVAKAKVEEIERAATPEPVPAKGGLSSLLGGWWGRK